SSASSRSFASRPRRSGAFSSICSLTRLRRPVRWRAHPLRSKGRRGGELRRPRGARTSSSGGGAAVLALPVLARGHPADGRLLRKVVRLPRGDGLRALLAHGHRVHQQRDRRLLLSPRARVHVHARAGGGRSDRDPDALGLCHRGARPQRGARAHPRHHAGPLARRGRGRGQSFPGMTRILHSRLEMRLFLLSIAIFVGGCGSCKGGETGNPQGASPDSSSSATTLASAAPSQGLTVLPIPSASVLKMLNPNDLPAYNGPVGSIEGDVFVTGDPAPAEMGKSFTACPEAASLYAKQFRDGPPRADGSRPLADAIVAVQLVGTGLFVPEKNESVLVTIDQCSYSTRTVVLTYGQRLDVKNLADPATKKLYAPEFENAPSYALMIATPGADPVKLYPKSVGRYRLVDKIKNDWMEADVFVIGHPLHAVSNAVGHFRLDGVPIGKRTLNFFHRAIPGEGVNKDVEV